MERGEREEERDRNKEGKVERDLGEREGRERRREEGDGHIDGR